MSSACVCVCAPEFQKKELARKMYHSPFCVMVVNFKLVYEKLSIYNIQD